MGLRLSVCIPTYNRRHFLEIALQSIIAQANDEVEIVISDNASTDGTDALVKKYQQGFPRIRYFRWPKNEGPDRNFLKVVELATAEYCWFLGSDDAIAPGMLQEVLSKLEGDLLLLNLVECDYHLKPIGEHHWLDGVRGQRTFDFSTPGSTSEFFQLAQPLMGMFLGYISCIVVRKESWDSVAFNEDFIGSFFSFTYVVLNLINRGCRLKYIQSPVVLNRGYNDSMGGEFSKDAELKRTMLDIDAYLRFAAVIQGIDNRQAFLAIAKKNYSWYPLLKLRRLVNWPSWKELCNHRLLPMGLDPSLLRTIGWLGALSPILNGAFRLKKAILPRTRIVSRKWY